MIYRQQNSHLLTLLHGIPYFLMKYINFISRPIPHKGNNLKLRLAYLDSYLCSKQLIIIMEKNVSFF